MGFFSQDCDHCGHPALCQPATQDRNGWMTDIVVVTPNGSIIRGTYDGYGRLDGDVQVEDAVGFENMVFHRLCWEAAGKPTTYNAPSRHSADQGWFFGDDEHNWGSPAEAKAHPPQADLTAMGLD